MNSKNPPPLWVSAAGVLRIQEFLAWVGARVVIFILLCMGGYRLFTHNLFVHLYRVYFLGVAAIVLLALSHRWEKQCNRLLQPLPLTSWICHFPASGHVIEIAFQFPAEYMVQQYQDRIQIAVQAALRNFKPDILQPTLQQALSREVDELGIPVFRFQILKIDEVAVSPKGKDPSIYI